MGISLDSSKAWTWSTLGLCSCTGGDQTRLTPKVSSTTTSPPTPGWPESRSPSLRASCADADAHVDELVGGDVLRLEAGLGWLALGGEDRGNDVDHPLYPGVVEVAQGLVGPVGDEVGAHLADGVVGQAIGVDPAGVVLLDQLEDELAGLVRVVEVVNLGPLDQRDQFRQARGQ